MKFDFKIFILLFLLPFLCLHAQDSLKSKGDIPEIVKKSKNRNAVRRAVVIGISHYKNIESLNYADKDAIAFAQYLLSKAGGSLDTSQIKVLLNEDATSANIWRDLSWLLDASKENDESIIFFSGHGDVERKLCPQLGFLLGYDSPNSLYPSGGTISVDFLQTYAQNLSAKKINVLFIIDACKSGKLAGGDEGKTATGTALEKSWGSINKILSCQPSEISLEDKRWCNGSGVFTCNLIEGLQGLADESKDGNITLLELYNYLTKSVNSETNNLQTPVVKSEQIQTVIARVDNETLADLKRKKNIFNTENYTTSSAKGMNYDIEGINDTLISSKIFKFYEYLYKGKLLLPENDNAYVLFKELKNENLISGRINDLKYSLIAALQNKSQTIINSYLSSIEISDSISFENTVKQLEAASELLGNDNYLYKYTKARELFLAGVIIKYKDFTKALELFQQSLKLESEAAYVYNEIGSIYLRNNDFIRAEENFKKASEISPGWVYPLLNLGNLYGNSNHPKRDEFGLYFLNKAVSISPDYAPVYYNKGTYYYNRNNIEEAINCFNIAIEKNNNYTDALFLRGELYLKINKYNDALNDFEKIIKIDSLYKNIRKLKYYFLKEYEPFSAKTVNLGFSIENALIYTYRAVLFFDRHEFDKCINDFSKSIEYDANNANSYYNRGLAFFYKKDYHSAIHDFEKALILDPGTSEVYYSLAMTHLAIKDYLKAIDFFNKCIELNFNLIGSYYNRAECNYNLQDYEKSVSDYTSAIKIMNSEPTLYYNRGTVYIATKQYQKAIEDYTKCIQLNPEECLYYAQLAYSYSLIKEFDNSILNYSKAIGICNNRGDLYFNRGNMHFSKKEFNNAYDDYTKAISLNPDLALYYVNRGLCCSYLFKYDEELQNYEKAIEIDISYESQLRPLINEIKRK